MARVVIADDAPFVREVLTHLLRAAGYDVVAEAVDGEEAVQITLQHVPDVVIMDIVMPKMSGIKATQEILKLKPNIKIIGCSTESSESLVTQAIEAGCIDFITKPFEQKNVIKILQSALNRKDSKKRRTS